jgi:hypothetical protein
MPETGPMQALIAASEEERIVVSRFSIDTCVVVCVGELGDFFFASETSNMAKTIV